MNGKGKTFKILLVGSRYTGKGQIGRAWAHTDADLPTLQPVMLYERMVTVIGNAYRVMAWVLSFDPEFEDLRTAFYSKADGIILTYDANDTTKNTFTDLLKFLNEIKQNYPMGLPPAVTFGARLTDTIELSNSLRKRVEEWANKNTYGPVIQGLYSDKEQFQDAVDSAFKALLEKIFQNMH